LRISHAPQLGSFPLALLRIISLLLTWRIANDCILVDDFPLAFKNDIFSLRVNTPFSAVSFRPPTSGRFSLDAFLNAQDWQETVLYYLLLQHHRDRYVLGAGPDNILTDSLGRPFARGDHERAR
jgi:hypothetical protein